MIFSADPPVLAFTLVLVADIIAVAAIVTGSARRRFEERVRRRVYGLLMSVLSVEKGFPDAGRKSLNFLKKQRWVLLQECSRIADSTVLSDAQRGALEELLIRLNIDKKLGRDLGSRNSFVRARAAVYISFVTDKDVKACLVKRLETEPSHAVKLSLVASLATMGVTSAIPTIIDSLKDTPLRYQQAVWGLVAEFGDELEEFIPLLIPRREKEIQFLLIYLAGRYCSTLLCKYIEGLTRSRDLDIARAAFRVLSSPRAATLDYRRYLSHEDFLIRSLTAESLGNVPRTESLAVLFEHLDDGVIRKSAVLAMSSMIRARPSFLRIVMYRCLNERRPNARRALVDVLANFVDYLMGKLDSPDAAMIEQIIVELVKCGKTNDIVNFLNRNANAVIEEKVIAILKSVFEHEPGLSGDILEHANKRIVEMLGFRGFERKRERPQRMESHNLPLLYAFLAIGTCLVPSVCLALAALKARWGPLPDATEFLRLFAACFNYAFALYSGALSTLYLFLLLFSIRAVRRQARIATLLRHTLLFKESVLPSISIVSPAYNEESTIVESVNALFNLHYPDYEIIVVNDGSSDGTLERLIRYFELERTDIFIHGYLRTQEVRGVYANKRYPELIVVDKANGGKADSLNAGINIARKEYFSGIDADSLLDRDALLNLAGLFLFSEEAVTAAGGNILPVNGCTVRKGALVETRIPKRHIARFQTIEYIRAFMAGRVGWADLKLLLIISGAFGVFHRRSVINAHGYLTQSEHFTKDTVGEDMELVVRLSRMMRENKTPFSIIYGYNANCWTEIPERFAIFASQRDRWQRGLLDIVSFHSRILFNPAYGRIGLFGMPYFLVFEILGPWLELEGFLVFVVSFVLGWIVLPLLLLIFASTVGLSFLVSALSILLVEYKKTYFPLRDKIVLLLYAIVESLGVRQLFNFMRVRGFMHMLARKQGWGKMERRGWTSAPKDA
jgi:cellulose synthase/poly-beta-1,6-N-acetylglucosamine synthase-like glycosyltransferase/HEAT repeat protein